MRTATVLAPFLAASLLAITPGPLAGTQVTLQSTEAGVDSLVSLADARARDGDYGDAQTLYERALQLSEEDLGPDHPQTGKVLHGFGTLYYRQGKYAEAELRLRRALAIREAALGPDHVAVGKTLNNLGSLLQELGRYAEAQPMLERSLAIMESSFGPDHTSVAFQLDNLANLYKEQGRRAQAEPLHERALAILERTLGPEHPEVAWSLNNLANLYTDQGKYREAEPMYRRALSIREQAFGPDDLQVASTLSDLGLLLRREARYAEAEPLLERSVAISRAALGPNHPDLAPGLTNLANLYVAQGRRTEAEPLYLRSLEIRETALGSEHPAVAANLNDLANLYVDDGRYAEAKPLYDRALAIKEQALGPEHPNVARTLNDLAWLYEFQRDEAAAEALYQRSLTIVEKTYGPNHPRVAGALNDLALLYRQQGRGEEAEQLLRQALAIAEESLRPDHPDIASYRGNLANLYVDGKRYAEAEPLYRRALRAQELVMGQDHPQLAFALIGLAYTQSQGGEKPEAGLSYVDRAIEILEATGFDPDLRLSAYALRAQLRKASGDTDGAFLDLEEAVRTAEDLRPQVAGGEETRARFFQRYVFHFEQMVEWQVEAGEVEHALAYAERARARALLDQLAAGKIDIRSSIPADILAPLEEREREAKARLAEYQQRITLERSRAELTEEERAKRLAELSDSLRLADSEYRQVYADIKNASPLWRDEITSGGRPSSLRDIQRTVVPRDGLMLSYQIGLEASFVFVIPPRGGELEAIALEITGDAASALGVKPGPLTTSVLQTILAGESTAAGAERGGLFHDLSTSARGIKVAGGRQPRDPEAQLHALWEVLLPGAVWADVSSTTEVVVVPDGPLHYLPFEALVVDTAPKPDGVTYWLDAGPPIRYAASATALTNITQRPSARVAASAAGPMMLSVSDPIFDPAEVASLRQSHEGDAAGEVRDTTSAAGASPVRDSEERSGGWLARLPGTALETEAVRETFGAGAATRLQVLSGLEATEANLRATVDGKRFLHFATHGLVDQRRGTLFASLALTPPAGETADLEDDGFWQLHEIYEQRMPEVELAVLSACESNVGQRIEGEGVFALSRGFSAAGAQRVVASQWAVDDASTAALIGEFFRQVITEDTEGRQVHYAVALRDAKLAVRSQAQWSHPYFWAPFVLTGKQ